MKVLIVRTFPDVLNLNTYNVQEIGLAKALTCKGVTCGVVLYAGKSRKKDMSLREREKVILLESTGSEAGGFLKMALCRPYIVS